MTNRETGIQHEGEKFALLPNSYQELSNTREALGARLSPLVGYIKNRYDYMSSQRDKAVISGQEYMVQKTGSSNGVWFYTEDSEGIRSSFIISVNQARARIEKVEHMIDIGIGVEAVPMSTTVDFSHNHVRINQEADGHYFRVDTSGIWNVAALGVVIDNKEVPLVSVSKDSLTISPLLGQTVTDLKTGERKVEGQYGTFYLPPADQLLVYMVRQALNLERVSLPQRSI